MSEDPVDLVPARMVNEFVYCPRLFYYEWVRKEWADNADTAIGDLRHDSIDRRGGSMPEPGSSEPPLATARVTVESPQVGLTGVIDRVDHTDGYSVPVDYKKGKGPFGGGAWPADEAQIWCQAALLEDAGYQVREGLLLYRESHSRVTVPWDETAREKLSNLLREATAVAQREDAPPPLVNSPKCPRCSLVSLCLPDETSLRLERQSGIARTITPRNPDQRPLYLAGQGTKVGVSGKILTLSRRDEPVQQVRLIDVSHACLVGNVQASTQALHALWRQGSDVIWLSYGGWLAGYSQGAINKNVAVRLGQYKLCGEGLDIARAMVQGKIHNQRVMMRRHGRHPELASSLHRMKQQLKSADMVTSIQSLLGVEGTAAREYFKILPTALSPDPWATDFAANGRKRRPAPDPVNAVLGFCYALLLKEAMVAVTAAGFDPYIGIMHRPRFGHPALALDLVEEFRPLIGDSVMLQVFNNGELRESDFRRHSLGTQLTTNGRQSVIKAFERRMLTEIRHPEFGYKVSYRRIMDVQARLLAAVAVGELSTYVAFRTR